MPSSVTNVFFSTSNPVATNLTTTLDASYVINSMTFTGLGGSATINSGVGTNTLTINAGTSGGNTLGSGIVMNAGAPTATINVGVVLANTQTWTNNSANALNVTGAITGSGTQSLTLAGSGSINLSGSIASSVVNLTMSGTGVATLSGGSNAYTGTTTISSGVVDVALGGSIGSGALVLTNANSGQPGTQVGLFLFDNVTVATLTGSITTPAGGNTEVIFVNTGKTLTVTQTAGTTYAGTIYGGGGFTLASASNNVLQLSGNSLYTGTTTINGGTLQINTNNALPTGSALVFATSVSGGTAATLNLNGNVQTVASLSGGSATAGFITTGGGTLTVTSGGGAFVGAITGTGGLTLAGTSSTTLILSGNSTYTGGTAINGGTLQIGANWALTGGADAVNGATPTQVTFANVMGTQLNLNGFNVAISAPQGGGVLWNGTQYVPTGVINIGSNSSTNTLDITLITNTTNTYAGAIVGGGSGSFVVFSGNQIAPNGEGTIILTGNSTYAGSTIIDPGTVELFTNNALPVTTNLTIDTGATLDLNTFIQAVPLAVGAAGNVTTGTTSNSGLLIIQGPSSSNTTFTGVISESGGLQLSSGNAGAQTLGGGGSSYSGGTAVYGGQLVVNNTAGSGTGSGNVTVGGVALTGSGTSPILSGTGTIVPGAGNSVTVTSGGTIRGGDPVNGTGGVGGTQFGTLSINNNTTVTSTGNTATTTATIQTQVARTGVGSVAGSNSLIDLGGSPTAHFNLGTSGTPLSSTSLMTINVADGGTLQTGENYLINLAHVAAPTGSNTLFTLNGNTIVLNPTGPNNVTVVDQGAGVGVAGAGSYAMVTLPQNSTYAGFVTSWTLEIDSTGQYLQLALTTPEPHHLLLVCSGVLFLGLTIRRRWRAWRAASVA